MEKSEIIVEATNFILKYLQDNNLNFTRGNPEKFFTKLSTLHLGLTLTSPSSEIDIRAINLKNLSALWNILVDDEIDVDKSDTRLRESFRVLSQDTLTGSSLYSDLLIPFQDSKWHDITKFDLLQICQGFNYEFVINNNIALASSEDYDLFSTQTASILYYLDVDFLYSNLDISSYITLRAAYNFFGKAVKYASDIGSLAREMDKEQNLNSVLIQMREDNIVTDEQLFDSAIIKRPEVVQILKRVKDLAVENCLAGESALKDVTGINTKTMHASIKGVIDSYLSGIDF